MFIRELFNLAADSEDESYSDIVQKLPMFLPLVPFADHIMRIPVLVNDRAVSSDSAHRPLRFEAPQDRVQPGCLRNTMALPSWQSAG